MSKYLVLLILSVINFFHTIWPELLELNNFIISLATPIVKISKGKNVKSFSLVYGLFSLSLIGSKISMMPVATYLKNKQKNGI